MNPATEITASNIRRHREAVGLSREGLAYKAGLSIKTIERIEGGKNEPRRATLAVISRVLVEEGA